MLGFSNRRKKERYLKTVTRVQALERCIYSHLRHQFVERHGDLRGGRLGQAAVDKLFGRTPVLSQDDSALAESLAAEIATESKIIRDAAFISLRAMLEIEGETHNFSAERRMLDRMHWLKQFGETPRHASEPDALERISQMLCGHTPTDNKSHGQISFSLKVLPTAASEE